MTRSFQKSHLLSLISISVDLKLEFSFNPAEKTWYDLSIKKNLYIVGFKE